MLKGIFSETIFRFSSFRLSLLPLLDSSSVFWSVIVILQRSSMVLEDLSIFCSKKGHKIKICARFFFSKWSIKQEVIFFWGENGVTTFESSALIIKMGTVCYCNLRWESSTWILPRSLLPIVGILPSRCRCPTEWLPHWAGEQMGFCLQKRRKRKACQRPCIFKKRERVPPMGSLMFQVKHNWVVSTLSLAF